MVDMGQAERSLYFIPHYLRKQVCWTIALARAATYMGYAHYADVPDTKVRRLKRYARFIQKTGARP
jgi:hypothetical protein